MYFFVHFCFCFSLLLLFFYFFHIILQFIVRSMFGSPGMSPNVIDKRCLSLPLVNKGRSPLQKQTQETSLICILLSASHDVLLTKE